MVVEVVKVLVNLLDQVVVEVAAAQDLLVVQMVTLHLELLMQHLHQMDLEDLVVTLMVVMVAVVVVPLVLVEMEQVIATVLVQVVTDLV